MKVIEDMEEAEVILEEVVFMEDVMPLEEMMIGIEIERIPGLVDNQDHEIEKQELDWDQALGHDQIQELV